MSIFLIKNPGKIKEEHLINVIENWDVIIQTVSYGYKLFGKGGVINYSREDEGVKEFYNLLKFRISKYGRDIEDDEISFSTSIIPCWDLFSDTDEALKIDGFLFNLAQSYDPNEEFYYSITEKRVFYDESEIDGINIELIGKNQIGSDIYIFKLPTDPAKLEKLGIKVLSNLINKQSKFEKKKDKLSRFLRKKQIEFYKA